MRIKSLSSSRFGSKFNVTTVAVGVGEDVDINVKVGVACGNCVLKIEGTGVLLSVGFLVEVTMGVFVGENEIKGAKVLSRRSD